MGNCIPRPEAEPTQEIPGGFLHSHPKAASGQLLVVTAEEGQYVILDNVAPGGSATIEKAHHLRIAVQLGQVLHVGLSEPALRD